MLSIVESQEIQPAAAKLFLQVCCQVVEHSCNDVCSSFAFMHWSKLYQNSAWTLRAERPQLQQALHLPQDIL